MYCRMLVPINSSFKILYFQLKCDEISFDVDCIAVYSVLRIEHKSFDNGSWSKCSIHWVKMFRLEFKIRYLVCSPCHYTADQIFNHTFTVFTYPYCVINLTSWLAVGIRICLWKSFDVTLSYLFLCSWFQHMPQVIYLSTTFPRYFPDLLDS